MVPTTIRESILESLDALLDQLALAVVPLTRLLALATAVE
jgi:hypothetical protein